MIKKSSGKAVKNRIKSNKELAEELHKDINKKAEKRKIYSSFIDNIWGADLSSMQLISKSNKGIRFFYVLLIFLLNKHELFLWKIKKVLQLLMLFKKS